MRRELRQGITKGFVDLPLSEIAGLFQDRAGEICADEPRAREVGAFEQRIAEIRTSEIGAVETRIREIGIRQVRHFQICAGERGETQRGVASRVKEKLIGPPLIGPIWRSPALKLMPVRFGVREGFCVRHSFHKRGPRRKASRCLESADNATHATGQNATHTNAAIERQCSPAP